MDNYGYSAQHLQDVQRFIDTIGNDVNRGYISRHQYLKLVEMSLDNLEKARLQYLEESKVPIPLFR